MSQVEVKRSPDGKILARRKDGQPLTPEDRAAARELVKIETAAITAVEICSPVVEAHIWVARDDSFDPQDGLAVFYGHELAHLKNKTPEQLKKIHALKLGAVGLGTKVRQ